MPKSNRVRFDAAIIGHRQSESAIKLLETPSESSKAKEYLFAVNLHKIVSDENTNDCIHWLPCGKRFMISDKCKFVEDVLIHYFDSRGSGNTKFTSFTRRLKRWLFKRVPSGPQMGAYYRENFLKDRPDLAKKIIYSTEKSRCIDSTRNAINSKSLDVMVSDDPLMDEHFGYRSHLGQDFESFMSSLDNRSSSWKSCNFPIDNDINLTAVFQM